MAYTLTITEAGRVAWARRNYAGDSTGDSALGTLSGRLRELGVREAEIDALHDHFAIALATGSGNVYLTPGSSFTGRAGRFGVEIVRT